MTCPTICIASVLVPLPVMEAFDYSVPQDMTLKRGQRVRVPLGRREVIGIVEAVRHSPASNMRLRDVIGPLDGPPLPGPLLDFLVWSARWTLNPPGLMAQMALRGSFHPPPRPGVAVVSSDWQKVRETPARARIREVLDSADGPVPRSDLLEQAGASPAVLAELVRQGACTLIDIAAPDPFAPPRPDFAPATLSAGQDAVRARLDQALIADAFSAHLLDGVTGSGKTETYLEVLAGLLAREPDAQALILLPEIALTQAVMTRFAERFGALPAEWHSAMPPQRRRQVWDAVAQGRARIVVGARSALFLPFPALRLIVVDEEHDGAYKQEDGLIYQARDLAVARARFEGAVCVLASATPSMETLSNARSGRYGWLKLRERHGPAVMPDVSLIDLRAHPPEPGQWLSTPLRIALRETLEAGQQAMLFLNRRGYAPVVLCRACGHRLSAPDTDSWLVEHRYSGRLVCHLTGFSMPRPESCPHCHQRDSLVSVGPGVERIEEEVASLFPEARTAVFSSDTVAGAASARAMIDRMRDGEIDVMVATQAAAKGHNFPGLTLVGVVDADLGLKGGDLRAAERTFQLLTQASGRAGRAEARGRALIQTWTPEHPVMQALAATDRDRFCETELGEREVARLPPFGRLCALILSSENVHALDEVTRALSRAIPRGERLQVFGPAEAPLALVRGRRRRRFLVRADRDVDLQAYVRQWTSAVKVPASVRLTIDVDPYSFL
ncbi:MAG: primosomal protein N' [Brevundimonas sp.]|uniref:primosomal protein N' n=1 Tax=Brevundimonas sp. TaxID=1871086 RepID=UPI00391C242C